MPQSFRKEENVLLTLVGGFLDKVEDDPAVGGTESVLYGLMSCSRVQPHGVVQVRCLGPQLEGKGDDITTGWGMGPGHMLVNVC